MRCESHSGHWSAPADNDAREALVIALVALPWPRWGIGLLFGTLLSVPSALITRAYVPILVTGAIGGLLVGLAYPVVVR